MTFSFLISSPLVDMASVILLASIFSWPIALAYVGVGLMVAIIGGTIIGKLGMEDQVAGFVRNVPVTEADETLSRPERVAFARIVFAPGPATRWEMALVKGQDPATLGPDEFFGYGVDSGTGGFMDAAALRSYEARRNQEGEAFDDQLFAELDKTYQHTRSWYLLPTDAGNVAFFSSGYGDGAYPSYFGYDANGKLVAVVTDFLLVPWR